MMKRCRFLLPCVLLTYGMLGAAGRASSQDAKDLARSAGLKAGLCVVLGSRDGKLEAELARSGDFLVHGVCLRREDEALARQTLEAQGLYGTASAEHLKLSSLPYADRLVNLVVAPDFPGLLENGLSMPELWRVLCPGGVAMLGGVSEEAVKSRLSFLGPQEFLIAKGPGTWLKVEKRRPVGLDDWTNVRHGSDGNRVSQDAAGVPTGPQWMAGPVWGPHVWSPHHLAAGGRYFHVPPGGREVVARDAFNGLPLWKRARKEETAECELWAATGRHVYAVLDGKLRALDASTGEPVASFGEAGDPEKQILLHRDLLILEQRNEVRAFDASSGRLRWNVAAAAVDLVAGEGRLFYLDTAKTPFDVVGLDLESGKEAWRKSTAAWQPGAGTSELYTHHRAVILRLFQEGKLFLLCESEKRWTLRALAAQDARELWTYKYSNLPYFNKDVLFQKGSIWVTRGAERTANPWHGVVWEALNPADGSVQKSIDAKGLHAGCQSSMATQSYLLIPKSMRFVETDTGKVWSLASAYGACGRGVIAGNGLLFAPPFACGCPKGVLRGYVALSSTVRSAAEVETARLETGPMEEIKDLAPREGDWPTYRGNAWRGGTTKVGVPPDLKPAWEVRAHPAPDVRTLAREGWDAPGNRWITSPVCAEDLAAVAYPEFHRVSAYEASTGRRRWSFTAGARITSPPTLASGRTVFGCNDGWVYCLRSKDGTLLWRYRAAPQDDRFMAFGQLESHWPVPGSVLVEGRRVYGVAGRSNMGRSDVNQSGSREGELRVFALELSNGQRVWEKRPPAGGNSGFSSLNDVLVSDGRYAYLREWRFDLATGENHVTWWLKPKPEYVMGGVLGLLDDSWTRYSAAWHSHQQVWKDGRGAHGQVLIMDRQRTFGFRARHETQEEGPGLFAQDYSDGGKGRTAWTLSVPEPGQVESLLLAGETLWAAGPVNRKERREGFLWAISAVDGKRLQEIKLPTPPVFQGLAAAMGRLFVSAADGKLLCLGKP